MSQLNNFTALFVQLPGVAHCLRRALLLNSSVLQADVHLKFSQILFEEQLVRFSQSAVTFLRIGSVSSSTLWKS